MDVYTFTRGIETGKFGFGQLAENQKWPLSSAGDHSIPGHTKEGITPPVPKSWINDKIIIIIIIIIIIVMIVMIMIIIMMIIITIKVIKKKTLKEIIITVF